MASLGPALNKHSRFYGISVHTFVFVFFRRLFSLFVFFFHSSPVFRPVRSGARIQRVECDEEGGMFKAPFKKYRIILDNGGGTLPWRGDRLTLKCSECPELSWADWTLGANVTHSK